MVLDNVRRSGGSPKISLAKAYKYTENNNDITTQTNKRINIFNNITALENKMKLSMENIDSFFLMVMGILVFFMQTGFAFLEAGFVR